MGAIRTHWDAGNPQAPQGFADWGEEVTDWLDRYAEQYVDLTNDSPAVASTHEDWGAETITFPNPGRLVQVVALVTGMVSVDSLAADATAISQARAEISVDGGATFSATAGAQVELKNTSGHRRGAVVGQHKARTTPTGDIIVKAALHSDKTGVNFSQGSLSARMSVIP